MPRVDCASLGALTARPASRRSRRGAGHALRRLDARVDRQLLRCREARRPCRHGWRAHRRAVLLAYRDLSLLALGSPRPTAVHPPVRVLLRDPASRSGLIHHSLSDSTQLRAAAEPPMWLAVTASLAILAVFGSFGLTPCGCFAVVLTRCARPVDYRWILHWRMLDASGRLMTPTTPRRVALRRLTAQQTAVA